MFLFFYLALSIIQNKAHFLVCRPTSIHMADALICTFFCTLWLRTPFSCLKQKCNVSEGTSMSSNRQPLVALPDSSFSGIIS